MEVRDPSRARRSLAITVVVALVLQVGLAPQIELFGGRFNFMLAFAGAYALTAEASPAVVAGFFAGLFYDLTSAAPMGLMALIMTIATFLLVAAAGGAGGGLSSRSIQFVFIYALAVSLVNGLVLFFMGAETSLLWALLGHGLSTAVLTTLAAVIFLAVQGAGDAPARSFSARGRKGTRYKGIR